VFDFSEHTLTTISTWAEVAILLFMVYEHYAPRTRAWLLGARVRTKGAAANRSRAWHSLWENRTLVVALIGLGIVLCLNFGRDVVSREEVEEQKQTLIEWLQRAESERDTARRDIAELYKSIHAKEAELSAESSKLTAARNALVSEKTKRQVGLSIDYPPVAVTGTSLLTTLEPQTGEKAAPQNALAWAKFSYLDGTLKLTGKSDAIADVKIEQEKGSISGTFCQYF